MPQIPRCAIGGQVLHILNRGNARATVFHHPRDYRAFIDQLEEAKNEFNVRLYALCIMPNHFHAVVRPETQADISGMMQKWLTAHVRRHNKFYDSSGHVWQGRFKSFPVQDDEHLLTAIRYVLLNPVRAQLSSEAMRWPWTSLHFPRIRDEWPLHPPKALESWLRDGIPDSEMVRIRDSIRRRAPFGTVEWQAEIAERVGLTSAVRGPGRPKHEYQETIM